MSKRLMCLCMVDVLIDKWLMFDVFCFEINELLIFCGETVDVLLMEQKSVDVLYTTHIIQEHPKSPSQTRTVFRSTSSSHVQSQRICNLSRVFELVPLSMLGVFYGNPCDQSNEESGRILRYRVFGSGSGIFFSGSRFTKLAQVLVTCGAIFGEMRICLCDVDEIALSLPSTKFIL